MEQVDLYEEVLRRRIYNLEKRMKWHATDLWFLKETYKRLFPKGQVYSKPVQLELFPS